MRNPGERMKIALPCIFDTSTLYPRRCDFMAAEKFCNRCGQKAARQVITEDGQDYEVFVCPSHKEVVYKAKVAPPEPAEAPAEAEPQPELSEPASSSVEPAAAAPTPKPLN